ncbi:MAG: FAD-binding domain-containing protein, partial [Planctomycetaceae bacterium]
MPMIESVWNVEPSDLTALVGSERDQLVAALAALCHSAHAQAEIDAALTTPAGGGHAASARLAAIDPVAYARSRNHVAGAVTGLSPWIRHGVLGLAEVRDAALARVATAEQAEKLIAELGWRDYWRQVHAALGDRIHADIEPPASASRVAARLDAVPADVRDAATGMDCIDAFVRRLQTTGWLHNHARMWLASWLVHVRGVRWQAGADWFLEHLLDGDPASNHLSWQWVAGTFAAKPYLFNRENLETFTTGVHCQACPVVGHCDVEGSYDDLSARLFVSEPAVRPPLRIRPAAPWRPALQPSPARPLVWLTLDSVSPRSPAATAYPDSPRVYVIDSGHVGQALEQEHEPLERRPLPSQPGGVDHVHTGRIGIRGRRGTPRRYRVEREPDERARGRRLLRGA